VLERYSVGREECIFEKLWHAKPRSVKHVLGQDLKRLYLLVGFCRIVE